MKKLLQRAAYLVLLGRDIYAEPEKSEYQKRTEKCHHVWGEWIYSGMGRSYRQCDKCGKREYD